MNIAKISSINFTGKIIDSHTHIGNHDGRTYDKEDLDIFIKSELPNKDTVEKMIVSDLDVLHGTKQEFEGNKAALEIFKDNKNYVILASCNPKEGNAKNIKKLYKKYPNDFKGLKFHPDIQQLELSDQRYEPYMEFASKNKLPCLFHSQVNILEDGHVNQKLRHISDPENIYTLAKKYPKTPVIMAHLGAGWKDAHDKTTEILIESIKKGDANLYADVSWVDIDDAQTHIVKAIKRLKGIGDEGWKYGDQSFRLMFGTDAPLARFKDNDALKAYTDFIEKIKDSIKKDPDLMSEADKIIDDLFYNNAKNLYLTNKKKHSANHKMLLGILVTILAAGIGFGIYKHKKNHAGTISKNIKNIEKLPDLS